MTIKEIDDKVGGRRALWALLFTSLVAIIYTANKIFSNPALNKFYSSQPCPSQKPQPFATRNHPLSLVHVSNGSRRLHRGTSIYTYQFPISSSLLTLVSIPNQHAKGNLPTPFLIPI